MDDNGIIKLYWDRNDQAINATSEKYGHYCKAIAKNILNNEEDAEECVNDTYLNAWNYYSSSIFISLTANNTALPARKTLLPSILQYKVPPLFDA